METMKAIDYKLYVGTYREDMTQRFADGELTDIEELKKFVYGYSTTDMYLKEGMQYDETLPRWWKENSNIRGRYKDNENIEGFSYIVNTLQEKLLLDMFRSTGDGLSKDTAIYITEVEQEYDYMEAVYPELIPFRISQGLVDSFDNDKFFDLFRFEDNPTGIRELWFECTRPMLRNMNMYDENDEESKL